jgi:hypothetical protein
MKRKRASKAIVHQPAAQFYEGFVEAIKERIRTAQIKAALAANAQLVLHYWEIGRDILVSQKREGTGQPKRWGTSVFALRGSKRKRKICIDSPKQFGVCVPKVSVVHVLRRDSKSHGRF